MRFVLVYLIILFLCGCHSRPAATKSAPRFVPSNKPPISVDPEKTPYTFGYLEVPENRRKTDSRMIRLPVYIFKSRSKNPAPDPVLYTVGGPGSSSMGAAPYMRAFRYLDDRDLILFEQRGTTHARPNLACPEWSEVSAHLDGQSLSWAASNAKYVAAATKCRDRLLAQNIDLDGYNTREIAADIEDLRRVLGIGQLNLLTISYSTKIAQTMMRDFPASLRSVVMDSPLPLAVSYDETALTNLMATYDTVFADCAAAPDCAANYPNLRRRFLNYLTDLSANPLELQVDKPDGKGKTPVQFTSIDVAAFLAELNSGEVTRFPAQLDAVIRGDTQLLKDNFSWARPAPGNGQGMRLSVWCSEELPFVDPEKVTEEMKRFPFLQNVNPMVFSFEVCRAWGVRAAPAVENLPVSSSIPTLLISGTYDPDTPVSWAALLKRELTNSHHLIFPGWTHVPSTYWDDPCAMEAANAFFNAPGQKPEVPCLADLAGPDFE